MLIFFVNEGINSKHKSFKFRSGFVAHYRRTNTAQQSVAIFITMTFMNSVTNKASAKHKILLNKLTFVSWPYM
jgi:hypothetical protein